MKLSKVVSSVLLASTMAIVAPTSVLAAGGASGSKVDLQIQGNIGEVIVDPYDIAPLTAVIRNGGYTLTDAKVTIVPKKDGQVVSYTVTAQNLKTHGGIPVFGLYADYNNTVEVEYTRVNAVGKAEKFKESYRMYAAPLWSEASGNRGQQGVFFKDIQVKKVEKGFEDRLYFVSNLVHRNNKGNRYVWNNPVGGALEWNYSPAVFVLDTKGEVRWYLKPSSEMYNTMDARKAGNMMGFKQNDDGAMTWGWGQNYAKYDILGREIFKRQIPKGYADYSHSMDNSPNGNYFLRVALDNYKRPDGKNVRTVRDVVVEVDANGKVIDDWRMFEMLDQYRDINIKVLDQGAVCLNVDASQSGATMSAEDLAKMDENDSWGDITGSGAGRNWAHINSVDHDHEDDSIILSVRHQSANIKVGRDKKVKWILSSPEGWTGELAKKVLTPVDSKGKKIKCEGSKCEGDFDWTWTQHTAFKIDSKSKGDILYLSVFDNGDSRGMEQPALASEKYSRAVIYKIDQKKMTVEQIWQYGKDKNDWYSPITSLTEYQEDKNSVFAYFATAGLNFSPEGASGVSKPIISEFKWGAKEPSVEIQMIGAFGYQAIPFSVEKAFSK